MAQSKASTVDAYLLEVPIDRAEAMRTIRALCLEAFPEWDEKMQWGMPGYGPPGADARISFNNQKGYIALYVGQTTVDTVKHRVRRATFGKGCIRLTAPAEIDFDLVAEILAASYRLKRRAAGEVDGAG